MTTQHKLWAVFAVLSLLLASVGIVAIFSNRSISRSFEGQDERFRAAVVHSLNVSNYAKEEESLVLVFLSEGDPAYRSEIVAVDKLLRQHLAVLNTSVNDPQATTIIVDIRANAERLSSTAAQLLGKYDEAVANGGKFDSSKSAELVKALDDAGDAMRRDGLKLAGVETDFLNKQAAITAATEVVHYARRAHYHLSVFLLLGNMADRDRFFARYKTLQDRISVLKARTSSSEGRAMLDDIEAGSAQLLGSGTELLADYDHDMKAAGAWAPENHKELTDRFLSAAGRVADSGLRMAEYQMAQEAAPKEQAASEAARLELVVLSVTASALILLGVLVYLTWKSIAKPVSRLSAAAVRVARGDLTTTVEVKSKDELGRLASSFNAMISALHDSKAELLEAKNYTERIIDSMDDGLIVVGADDVILSVNPSACRLLRSTVQGLVGEHLARAVTIGESGRSPADVKAPTEPGVSLLKLVRRAVKGPARGTIEFPGWPSADLDVTVFLIETTPGKHVAGLLLRDISERIRIEKAIRVSHNVLEIANVHTEMAPLLRDFTVEVKNFTACSAVGVRIFDEEGKDLHEAYNGSSKQFFEMPSPLCLKNDRCVCTKVIEGTTDKSLPFFTPGGSFYTNSVSRLVDAISKVGNGNVTAMCNQFGHESLALVPIKVNGRVRGIIQAADANENMVPWETVQVLESSALQLGAAIQRILAENKAVTDYLTGLFNQRHLRDRLENEVSKSQRQRLSFSLVMLDVDGFKNINESLGHLGGDRILREVGQMVKMGIREYDLPFRYGGDEFALILPGSDYEGAMDMTRRIMAMVEGLGGKEDVSFGLKLGLSAGIACFPEDGSSAQELLMIADVALFRAKQLGGNNIQRVSDLGKVGSSEWEAFRLNSVYALAAAVDARDHQTFGHSGRVAALCVALGYSMGLPVAEVDNLSSAALLHDVGKLSVPDQVLRKGDHLSEEEWEEVKKHPDHGAKIVNRIPQLRPILGAIRHHHERMDGQGYPDGLKGQDIPLEARIIAVVDAYDTMIGRRSYHPLMSKEGAVAELKRCSGTQFDPAVVEAFVALLARQEDSAPMPAGDYPLPAET